MKIELGLCSRTLVSTTNVLNWPSVAWVMGRGQRSEFRGQKPEISRARLLETTPLPMYSRPVPIVMSPSAPTISDL
jgi:hypothetical protein